MAYSIDSSPEFVVINSPEFVVKETPGMHDNRAMASSEVISNNEISDSTIVNASNELFSPRSMHSSPMTKSNGPHSRGTLVSTATPERTNADTSNPKPEMEISFNSSVNSCTQKKRKPMSFTIGDISQMELNGNLDAESPNVDCMRTISSCRDAACSSNVDCNECDNKNLSVAPVLMDKKLNICCSLCRSSLGLPDDHFLVPCSLTSSSKDYLVSFRKSRSQDPSKNESESIPVVISDIIYIDQRVYRRVCSGFTAEHDIWCEKEGCVFRTVFCPFCSSSDHFLGLQILATDAPNVHLLNKIFFYFDRLDIKSLEASTDEALLHVSKPDVGETFSGSYLAHTLMDKFLYVPKQETSGGWRAIKSKLRLPKKRGLFS